MSSSFADQVSLPKKADFADADEKRSVFRSWRRSLSAKLVTFAFALTAFTVIAVTAATIISVRSSIEENFTNSAVNTSRLLAGSVGDALKGKNMQLAADTLAKAVELPKTQLEGFVTLHMESGELRASDQAVQGIMAHHISGFLDGAQRDSLVEVTADSRHLVVINIAGVDNAGQPTGVLATAWSRDNIETQIKTLWSNGLRTGLLIFVILGGTLYIVLPRFLARPLIHAARSLTKLAQGDTSFEVRDVKRGDEVGGIARAIQVLKNSKTERDKHILLGGAE